MSEYSTQQMAFLLHLTVHITIRGYYDDEISKYDTTRIYTSSRTRTEKYLNVVQERNSSDTTVCARYIRKMEPASLDKGIGWG